MKQYDIAAYIWPSYTGKEPRTRQFWEQGIGEWQSVLSAEKRTDLYRGLKKDCRAVLFICIHYRNLQLMRPELL